MSNSTRKLHLYDNEIIEQYLAGDTLKVIGDKYGVSKNAIQYRLEKNNIPRRQGFSMFRDRPEQYDTFRDKQKTNTPHGKHHPSYKDIPLAELREEYESGISTLELAQKYDVIPGTIIYKLREAGAEIIQPPRQKICKDGHIAESNLEFIVDNWLYEHGIEHEPHPVLPWSKFRQADFLACGIYIEIWGIERNQKYEQRKAEKLSQYAQYGFQLISIYPKDVMAGRLDYILQPLLLI